MDTLIHTGMIMSLSRHNIRGNLEMRKYFYDIVSDRDGDDCHVCGSSSRVHAFHISHDVPHGGFVVENGVLLCGDCRDKAKSNILTSDYLYSLIGSSHELALAAYTKPKP